MVSLVIKKRTISLIILVLLGLALLASVLLGSMFSKNKSQSREIPAANYSNGVVTIEDIDPPKMSLPAGDDFFVEYKLERERTRGQRVEWLREVINNNNSTSDARQKAQEHLMAISRNMQKESELESLLKAKGFRDAAVMVDDRAVTVVVGASYLSTGESTQIIDLVARGTGVDAQNIVIITKT